MEIKEIFNRLKQLHNNSYSKYSNYKVSSIVETEKGFYEGVNIENASFSLTICAERLAIFNAVLCGNKKISRLYLLTDNEKTFGTPCGACRQVFLEFMDKETEIFLFNKEGEYKILSVDKLIPFAWDSSMLN